MSGGFHTPRNSKNIFHSQKTYSYHTLLIQAYIFITQKG